MVIDAQPLSLEEVLNMYDRPAYVQHDKRNGKKIIEEVRSDGNETAEGRLQAVYDTALGLGVNSGIAWQLAAIRKTITKQERNLDTVYNFNPLMIKGRVVPPVITETRDVYSQEGEQALRLSGAYYKIEKQAHFSSVPPNWRGYLDFPQPTINTVAITSLKPKDSDEEKIWESAVKDGWQQGIEQANIMFEHGLDQLNRDYTGMMRFHRFALKGMITLPAIASESINVTSTGQTMAVDETLLRLTTLPEFNSKMNAWGGEITSSSTHRAKPHKRKRTHKQ